MKKLKNKGFTLIEILIVIAIIGILALVVFVALNPAGRFADARNANRVTNIDSIGNAIQQYNLDHNGTFPTGANAIPSLNQVNGTDTNGFNNSTKLPDCTYASVSKGSPAGCEWADDPALAAVISPQYLSTMPLDTGTYTHYFVALTPDGAHVVVMSDSMDLNGVSSHYTIPTYFSIF